MKDNTRLTHKGRNAKKQNGFVNPPLYRGSTVLFPTLAELRRPSGPYVYGRHGTPATTAFTDLMLELEGGHICKPTPSGLSAITCAIMAFVSAGDHILVADSVYYPTRHFCDTTLKSMGVATSYYDPLIGGGIEQLITDKTRLIFMESPGSGAFEMQDTPQIIAAAARRELFVLMDNTWATPLYYRPLEHGVDVSIHSGTKYITGHSDAMLGVITANKRAGERLNATYRALGLCPGTEELYAGLKGLRTLGVRLARHQQTALELASWLEARPEVSLVLHPALPGFAGHDIWRRDFSGASGLFSFVLKPCSDKALAAFVDNLELFGMGWSWGGYESLIAPVELKGARTVTKHDYDGPILRIHAGLEDVEDLKADLQAGLQRLAQA